VKENAMNLAELVAAARVAPGRGILAADESLSTTNRRDYRKDANGKRNEMFAWQAGQQAKA
jgi:fructose-bisphosphate aldolase class 1